MVEIRAAIGTSRMIRFALCFSAAAMLAGCAGSQLPIGLGGAMAQSSVVRTHAARGALTTHQKAFSYTGTKQSFKVPASVTKLTVVADGASGNGFHGGKARGGEVMAQIPVTPGEKLAIFVGGEAQPNGTGGYNGGGNGGEGQSSCEYYCGLGGGGASDVREGGDALRNRVVVAAGGGGGGGHAGNFHGFGIGGGKHGVRGENGGGSGDRSAGGGLGGSQTAGGAGGKGEFGTSTRTPYCSGYRGRSGSLGKGGDGGHAGGPGYEGGGGGGGGGYYGGGGGGGNSCSSPEGGSAGGGGGSSYIEPSATHVHDEAGAARQRKGKITISWVQ
jgi:hypothetical protein